MATPFQQALFGIGFNQNQVVTLAVNGISHLEDIAMLTEDNICDVGKRVHEQQFINFPILFTQKLIIIRFW